MLWLIMLVFLLLFFYQFQIECCPSSKTPTTENPWNVVSKLLKEISVYKHAYKSMKCYENLKDYFTYYEDGMLRYYPHLITSENYSYESNAFMDNATIYFRKTNLLSLVKERIGLSDSEIDDNPRLQKWTFILNYIIMQATTEELTHPGLIEMKNVVTRKDSVWKGDYVRFAYCICWAYDMVYEELPRIRYKYSSTTPFLRSYREENDSDKPAALEDVLDFCMYLFNRVYGNSSMVTDSGYTLSSSEELHNLHYLKI